MRSIHPEERGKHSHQRSAQSVEDGGGTVSILTDDSRWEGNERHRHQDEQVDEHQAGIISFYMTVLAMVNDPKISNTQKNRPYNQDILARWQAAYSKVQRC